MVDADAAHDACAGSDYPDAVVQIAHLAGAARSGDVIVSAARDWDLRGRYEPIPHVSSHGALHREHMAVPLLVSRPFARAPRRTADVMPSALAALALAVPPGAGRARVLLSAGRPVRRGWPGPEQHRAQRGAARLDPRPAEEADRAEGEDEAKRLLRPPPARTEVELGPKEQVGDARERAPDGGGT
jgi:hypothetical protein